MSVTHQRKRSLDQSLRAARSDYASYVGTDALFSCQREVDLQVNADELAFQIVHQVEELWMKLAAHTLIDIEAGLRARSATTALLRQFARVDELLTLMSEQLAVLMTMSPEAYAEIRAGLGQGSGQDSPGYRALLQQAEALWPAFEDRYLRAPTQSLSDVYHDLDSAGFAVADAMPLLDTGLATFRHAHLQLVGRMIGLDSHSLKGLPAGALVAGVNRRLFGELWAMRRPSSPTVCYVDPAQVSTTGQDAVDTTMNRRELLTEADWQ